MTATTIGLNGSPATFLGAYIKNISSSLGFSTNPSSCTITLAEDPDFGVVFTEPEVGKYYKVELPNGWSFSGILVRYERGIRELGGRLITVTINDVREIMQNIPCILAPGSQGIVDGLSGTDVSLIDVFGAWNIADGAINISGWNETGMLYARIASALKGDNVIIGNTTITVPRRTARAFGEVYRFNIEAMTSRVDQEYRINSNLISISNLIEEMSTRHAFDWYVESERADDDVIDVTVKIIDRSTDNVNISLPSFLSSHEGRVVSCTSGVELRNEIACIAMQGAPVENMLKADIIGLANEPVDLVPESGANNYIMTEEEMRVVLSGRQAWEIWLSIQKAAGEEAGEDSGWGFSRYGGYLTDGMVFGVLPGAADLLSKLRAGNILKNEDRLEEYLNDSLEYENAGKVYEKLKSHADSTYGKRFVHEDIFNEIIDSCWTRDVLGGNDDPDEYFRQDDGRTRAYVEFVVGADSTNKILAFSTLTESYGNNPVFRSVTQFGKTFEDLITNDNLIEAGAVLPLENQVVNPSNCVISWDKSNYTYNGKGGNGARTALYCACSIDKDGVVTIESPLIEPSPTQEQLLSDFLSAANNQRVSSNQRRLNRLNNRIIEMKAERDGLRNQLATIFNERDNIDYGDEYIVETFTDYPGDIGFLANKIVRLETKIIDREFEAKALQDKINNKADGNEQEGDEPANDGKADTDADGNEQEPKDRLIAAARRILGPGTFVLHAKAYQPRYVYIPTRSRINRYGPVFSSNLDQSSGGKLEIVQDDGFAPWEFGSVSLMEEAMQLKVDNATSQVKEVFSANITIEGLPAYSLGDSLERNANISSISISFGDGTKTTYQLQSFTRKFGELSKEDWARLALFSNNAGPRILPQRQISFVERHRWLVTKNFAGRGAAANPTTGGARNYG